MFVAALRRTVGTAPRRWILGAALLLGVLAAVAVSVFGSPTFAALSDPVQSLMSVVVPFTGALAAGDVLRSRLPVRPTLLAASALAAGVGLFGAAVCAVAATTSSASFVWHDAGLVAAGGVLVQVVAQLVGTGLGLLIRHRPTACLASIVLPLGLWFVLGLVYPPVQAWLTPYPSVRNLLSGSMSALAWAQWGVVVVLWVVGLNAAGTARVRRVSAVRA
ncbi:hypothetical protein [Amycolatopsis sp. NPDC051903]|uniref:hypothetical protein n=1 Tax=Amycolatopsis sp. NPDC051903 TaxID=3363936 RepID=UPI003799EBAA